MTIVLIRTFGSRRAPDCVDVTSTSITGTIPGRFAGPADVTVTDYWSRSGTLTDGFTYVLPPQTLTVTRAGSGTGW